MQARYTLFQHLQQVQTALLDLFFPPQCVHCGAYAPFYAPPVRNWSSRLGHASVKGVAGHNQSESPNVNSASSSRCGFLTG